MIVLKILLWILLAVLGLIVLILVIPAGAEVSYIGGKLSYKVKYWFISIMDSEGGGVMGWLKKRREKPRKPKPEKKRKKKDTPEKDDMLPAVTEETPAAAEEATSAQPDTQAASDVPDNAEDDIADDIPDDDPLFTGEDDEEDGSRKSKRKKKKKDSGGDSEDDEEEKTPLSDKIEFIISIWEQAQRPLLKIFKGFHLNDVFIDFIIADEDAYDCALTYGKMCAAVYNGLAQLSEIFTVKLKTVDVNCGFALSEPRWDAGVKLKVRPGTVVIAGLWFLITFIFKVFIPKKIKDRKARKTAAELKLQAERQK